MHPCPHAHVLFFLNSYSQLQVSWNFESEEGAGGLWFLVPACGYDLIICVFWKEKKYFLFIFYIFYRFNRLILKKYYFDIYLIKKDFEKQYLPRRVPYFFCQGKIILNLDYKFVESIIK
jgi:hypothetical protein